MSFDCIKELISRITSCRIARSSSIQSVSQYDQAYEGGRRRWKWALTEHVLVNECPRQVDIDCIAIDDYGPGCLLELLFEVEHPHNPQKVICKLCTVALVNKHPYVLDPGASQSTNSWEHVKHVDILGNLVKQLHVQLIQDPLKLQVRSLHDDQHGIRIESVKGHLGQSVRPDRKGLEPSTTQALEVDRLGFQDGSRDSQLDRPVCILLVKQNEIAIRGDVMALWPDLVNLHGAHSGSVSRELRSSLVAQYG